MTEHKEHKEAKPEDKEVALNKALEDQADWVRAIVRDEIAKWEKRQLHERRYGVPHPPKEAK